jgi:hypothetical protein
MKECQTQCWPDMSVGIVEPASLRTRVKLMLKRHLNPRAKRRVKAVSDRLINRFSRSPARSKVSSPSVTNAKATILEAGDLVRVRSRDEIQATLNSWNELKGCLFMEEMWQYCGTTQRVLKQVKRFVDERDYRVKRAKGLILLEGLICEGTPDYGRCDRACFYFWRAEWLEKVD